MKDLKKEAEGYFKANPSENIFFATEDGMFFTAANENAARLHARSIESKIKEFTREELEAEEVAAPVEEELEAEETATPADVAPENGEVTEPVEEKPENSEAAAPVGETPKAEETAAPVEKASKTSKK
jgi:hypothetical protein